MIGAGPAGAMAARQAALAGARTGLLERATLPRYKACGGGIVGVAAASLPPGVRLDRLARDRIDRLTVTLDGRRRYRAGGWRRRPLFSLVWRSDLDAALVEAATAAGVRLFTGDPVTGLAERDGVVVARTRGGSVPATVVIGADGTGGRSAGYVGIRTEQVDLGLEAEIPVPAATAARWRGRVLLDWGPLAGSYGWVFPKGDLLTVGVIGDRAYGGALRDYYGALLDRLGLDRADAVHDSGHLTRVRAPGSPLRRGGVLLAGDAAGLLEPWTREGISYALRSGMIAGRCAARAALAADPATAERELAAYPGRIEAALGAEMAAGRRFGAAFGRRPAQFHGALFWPPGQALLARLVRGETTYAALARNAAVRTLLRGLAPAAIDQVAGPG